MDRGQITWIEHDGRQIAVEVTGSGPDLLLFDNWVSNLDHDWDWPPNARSLRRLGESSRLIRFDRSGMGLSDRVPPRPEEAITRWTEEALAVLDAVDAQEVNVLASGWCGPLAIAVAARAPDRIDRMVLHDGFARLTATPDHPIGMDGETAALARELFVGGWGDGIIIDILGMESDARARDRQARYERSAASRSDISVLADAFLTADVRHLLADVTATTLVTYRPNPLVSEDQVRHLAQALDQGELRFLDQSGWEWPVADHDIPRTLLLALDFFSRSRPPSSGRRALMTVAFIDIVGSTPMVDRLGDTEWAAVLDAFEALLRDRLEIWHGRIVNQAGDGFLLTFDLPTDAVRCLAEVNRVTNELGTPIRAGVHVGECELAGDDLRGMSVHAAARIMSTAAASEILVSDAVRATTSDETFEPIGDCALRGVPGTWTLHRYVGTAD